MCIILKVLPLKTPKDTNLICYIFSSIHSYSGLSDTQRSTSCNREFTEDVRSEMYEK